MVSSIQQVQSICFAPGRAQQGGVKDEAASPLSPRALKARGKQQDKTGSKAENVSGLKTSWKKVYYYSRQRGWGPKGGRRQWERKGDEDDGSLTGWPRRVRREGVRAESSLVIIYCLQLGCWKVETHNSKMRVGGEKQIWQESYRQFKRFYIHLL